MHFQFKKSGFLLYMLIILTTFNTSVFAENYAVLISAGETTHDDDNYHSEYWYDLFLMYDVLYNNGFKHNNIDVLYGDGIDFQSNHIRYQIPSNWGISKITDYSNKESNINSVFNDLSFIMTDNDFLFVWWMGHGSIDGSCPDIKFWIENQNEYVFDHEFSSYVSQITDYKKRTFLFMTCNSGGIIDDLENNKSVISTAVVCGTGAHSRWYDVIHAEFTYLSFCALNWATASGSSINADYNNNGLVSILEKWDYVDRNHIQDDPQYNDNGNIGSNTYIFSAGHITRNTHILEDIDFTGDIYVDNNVSLTIDPNAVIKLEDDVRLEVNGNLYAQGTQSGPIIFTSINQNPSASDWYGIKVNGSANIDNAIIEYADKGINFNNSATGTISNSTFENNNYGIYLYHASPELENNIISSSTHEGIYMHSSSSLLTLNRVTNNNDDGIYIYGGSPQFVTGSFPSTGNNVIIDNSGSGISAFSSDVNMGKCVNCHSEGGKNSVFDNITNCYTCHGGSPDEKHIIANDNTNVYAENNWWGSSPPNSSSFLENSGSTIDYNPYLSSDPNTGSGNKVNNNPLSSKESGNYDHSKLSDLDLAYYYQFKGNYPLAISLYDKVIQSKVIKDNRIALRNIAVCYQLSEQVGFDKYLDNIILKNPKSDLSKLALQLKANLYVEKGFYDKALLINQNILDMFPEDNQLKRNAIYNKIMIYHNNLKDKENAVQAYNDLVVLYKSNKLCSGDKFVEHANILLFNKSSQNLAKKTLNLFENSTPIKFHLFNNYPNPFNPSTAIKYSIPKESTIDIIIFNLLGQKVKTFQINSKNRGIHNLTWDGKNSAGLNVPSGLYLLRFNAVSLEDDNQSFTKSIKMLLLR